MKKKVPAYQLVEKEVKSNLKEPIKVALEDLTSMVILAFCENLAELGCPKDEKNPDMWFRNLKPKQMYKVSSKLLDIIHSWDYKERV